MSAAVLTTKALPAAQRGTGSPITRSGLARRVFTVLGSATLAVGGLAACSEEPKPDPATWPDGAEVVASAAEAMGTLSSVHLRVDITPAIGGTGPLDPAIQRADLDLTAQGDSKGDLEALLDGSDAMTSMPLVALAPTSEFPDGRTFIFFTGSGWIEVPPLVERYDTAAILRPGEGLSAQLSTATDAVTVDSERMGGVDTWKVEVTFDSEVIDSLIPSVIDHTVTLTGAIWIAKDTFYIMRSDVHIPESPTGINKDTNVTMTLSAFNVPVEVSAPVI